MKAFIKLSLLFIATTLVFVLGFFHSLLKPRNPNNVYWTCQRLKGLAPNILGIEIKGLQLERLDQHRPCIFISNHQNNFDMFPGSWSLPRRTVTLGKTSLIWIPIFGLFYWLSGNFLINRKNKAKAYESLDRVRKKIQDEGTSVWIMPEGTRSWGRTLLPFKKGAFHLAIQAQVPIVPVCFSSYHQKFDFNQKRPGTIWVSALAPIETKGLKSEDAHELSLKAHEMMLSEISRLDKIKD